MLIGWRDVSEVRMSPGNGMRAALADLRHHNIPFHREFLDRDLPVRERLAMAFEILPVLAEINDPVTRTRNRNREPAVRRVPLGFRH